MVHKPVISYIAERGFLSNINFSSSNDDKGPIINVPIVRKRLTKTSYRNWNDKKELTDYIDSLYVPSTSNCYLHIKCHCGVEYVYLNKIEVPAENKICICGHKIIVYGN